jgi:hypothetical protein
MRTRFLSPRLRFAEEGTAPGAGEGGDGGAGGAGGGAPSPADLAAQAAAAKAAKGSESTDAPKVVGVDTTGWQPEAIAALAAEQARSRKFQTEAGDQRINAKKAAAEKATKDALKLVAEQFGLKIEGEAPTVESLSAQLAQAAEERDAVKGEATSKAVEAATLRQAMLAGIAPAKVPYLEFLLAQDAKFKALDPADEKLGDKVASAIAAQVAKDQSLKLTGSTRKSGAEDFGGAGENAGITKEQFASMDLAKRTKLRASDPATYQALVDAQYK